MDEETRVALILQYQQAKSYLPTEEDLRKADVGWMQDLAHVASIRNHVLEQLAKGMLPGPSEILIAIIGEDLIRASAVRKGDVWDNISRQVAVLAQALEREHD